MRSKTMLGGVQCEIIKLDNIPSTSNTSLSHGKNMWHLLSQQFWSTQYSIILDIHHTVQRNSNKNFFPHGRFSSPWPSAPHCPHHEASVTPVLLSALWLRLFQIPPTAEGTWHLSPCAWLTSRSVMPSRSICCCKRTSFFSKAGSYCLHALLFPYVLKNRRSGVAWEVGKDSGLYRGKRSLWN